MSWSDFILLFLLAVLAVGGAVLGIRIARWSRTDDGREWVDALSRLRGEEFARSNGWPINAAELSRRLLSASAPGEAVVTLEEYKLVQYRVRNTLRELGCPKRTESPRSDWMVDEAMAARVADALGYSSASRAAERPSRLSV